MPSDDDDFSPGEAGFSSGSEQYDSALEAMELDEEASIPLDVGVAHDGDDDEDDLFVAPDDEEDPEATAFDAAHAMKELPHIESAPAQSLPSDDRKPPDNTFGDLGELDWISPEMQHARGRNLVRFEAAKIKTIHPGLGSSIVAGATVEELLKKTPLRKITTSFRATTGMLSFRTDGASKDEVHQVHVGKMPQPHVDAFRPILVQILEHLPCRLGELGADDVLWVVSIAKRLAHKLVPQIRPERVLPHARPPNKRHSDIFIEGKVYGIDTSNQEKPEVWSMNFVVDPGTLRDIPISVPPEYEWVERTKKKEGRSTYQPLDKKRLNDPAILRAQDLAKVIVATFTGFIGTRFTCKERVLRFQMPYLKEARKARHGKNDIEFGPYHGFPLWYGPRQAAECNYLSVLSPGSNVSKDCTGSLPVLYIRSHDVRYWSTPLAAMLESCMVSADPYKIWRAGAIKCDEQNAAIRNGAPPPDAVPCEHDDKSNSWHVCLLGCRHAKLCADMVTVDGLEHDICKSCLDKLDDATAVSELLPPDPSRQGETRLMNRLYRSFKIEASHYGEEPTKADLQALVVKALKEMEYTVVIDEDGHPSTSKRYDAYFSQVLDDADESALVEDFRGYALHLFAPGLDAIDPIHKTTKGDKTVTGYHTLGNLSVCSFPANAYKKHHAVVIFVAVYQLRNGLDAAEYQSGIAILRNIYVNSMETLLNRSQQCFKVGNDVQPNYDEVKRCFRTGERLDTIHVPPQRLWATLGLRPTDDGCPYWRPEKWDYIIQGVTEIAQLNGLNTPELRRHWLRFDASAGINVPFFASEYTVVHHWTPYDFMTFMYERKDRLWTACDRLYAAKHANEPELRPTLPVELLIFEWAQQYMRLVRQHLDDPSFPPFRSPCADSWRLPFTLNVGSPLDVSFGHKDPGTQMRTGYEKTWPTSHGPESWKYKLSGMEVETQGKNGCRYSYPATVTHLIEEQFDRPRCILGPQLSTELIAVGNVQGPKPAAPGSKRKFTVKKGKDGLFRPIQDTPNPPAGSSKSRRSLPAATKQPQSLKAASATPSTIATSTAIGRANLARMGNSCWWSVGIQVLYSLAPVRALLRGSLQCRPETGRLREELMAYGEDPVSDHEWFMHHLSIVFDELDAAATDHNSPREYQMTSGSIQACNQVRLPKHQLHGDRIEAATDFLYWLIDRLVVAFDRSDSDTHSLLTPQEIYNAAVAAQSRRNAGEEQPQTLQEDAAHDRRTWENFGRTSDLVDLLYLQFVEEPGRPSCGHYKRTFHNEPGLVLKWEARSDRVDLQALISFWAKTPPEDVNACRRCGSDHAVPALRAVTKLPEILLLRLDRPPNADLTTWDDPVKRIHWSKVDNLLTINAASITAYDKLPSSSAVDVTLPPASTDSYELVAVFSQVVGDLYHFVAATLDSSTGQFVKFDDLAAVPEYVDLTDHLEEPDVFPVVLAYKLRSKMSPEPIASQPHISASAAPPFPNRMSKDDLQSLIKSVDRGEHDVDLFDFFKMVLKTLPFDDAENIYNAPNAPSSKGPQKPSTFDEAKARFNQKPNWAAPTLATIAKSSKPTASHSLLRGVSPTRANTQQLTKPSGRPRSPEKTPPPRPAPAPPVDKPLPSAQNLPAPPVPSFTSKPPATGRSKGNRKVCSNPPCASTKTTIWHEDGQGGLHCNACHEWAKRGRSLADRIGPATTRAAKVCSNKNCAISGASRYRADGQGGYLCNGCYQQKSAGRSLENWPPPGGSRRTSGASKTSSASKPSTATASTAGAAGASGATVPSSGQDAGHLSLVGDHGLTADAGDDSLMEDAGDDTTFMTAVSEPAEPESSGDTSLTGAGADTTVSLGVSGGPELARGGSPTPASRRNTRRSMQTGGSRRSSGVGTSEAPPQVDRSRFNAFRRRFDSSVIIPTRYSMSRTRMHLSTMYTMRSTRSETKRSSLLAKRLTPCFKKWSRNFGLM
ncbi:uncharacterized protein AB675_11175 [Cyphellophora attinorum]|uniref:GATA-type domain-containing protein n=1 Tax=Cyphellophora attinorum TaxID=1664694 RepID=A0A0N1GYH2_9EURO|nr:uncharacterized protein AB675_11175 [Phialophora attinorum]KPI35806.1 hypothetical protein AB675_11175 [Phialophora attinorum]